MEFQFSLSHSGQWVVCAVSEKAVGIDVDINCTQDHNKIRKDPSQWDVYASAMVTAPTGDKQLDAARGFIADGVKYILVSAADADGWDEVLQEAKDAGIGVFLFDRMVNADPSLYTAAVVSDMNKEGDTAVAWLESLGLEQYKILHMLAVPAPWKPSAKPKRTGPSFVKVPAETAGILKKPVRLLRLPSTPAKNSTSSTLRTTAWLTALWKRWTARESPMA